MRYRCRDRSSDRGVSNTSVFTDRDLAGGRERTGSGSSIRAGRYPPGGYRGDPRPGRRTGRRRGHRKHGTVVVFATRPTLEEDGTGCSGTRLSTLVPTRPSPSTSPTGDRGGVHQWTGTFGQTSPESLVQPGRPICGGDEGNSISAFTGAGENAIQYNVGIVNASDP